MFTAILSNALAAILIYTLSPRQRLCRQLPCKRTLRFGAVLSSTASLWAYATCLGMGYGILAWLQNGLISVCLLPLLLLWLQSMRATPTHTRVKSRIGASKRRSNPNPRHTHIEWDHSIWLRTIASCLLAPTICLGGMGVYSILNGTNNTEATFVMWVSALLSLATVSLCFLIHRVSTLVMLLLLANLFIWGTLFAIQTIT